MAGWDLRLRYIDVALSPAAVAANTTAEQTFTVAGVRADDMVLSVNKPTNQAGLGISGFRVSAEDEVRISFINATGNSITPTASQTYTIAVLAKQP